MSVRFPEWAVVADYEHIELTNVLGYFHTRDEAQAEFDRHMASPQHATLYLVKVTAMALNFHPEDDDR